MVSASPSIPPNRTGFALLLLTLLLCRIIQGIDLVAGGRNKKTKRTAPKSDDVYLKLLVKVRGPCPASSTFVLPAADLPGVAFFSDW
jgi:hypothetical protein